MKKTALIIIFALVAALTASLLAGCGADNKDGNADTDAKTEAQSAENAPADTDKSPDTDAPAQSDAQTDGGATYVNPLEGYETLSEDYSVANDENGVSMREYKFYRTHQFDKGDGTTYSWFQFYNACVTGELRLNDQAVVEYAEDCYDFFEDNEVQRELEHAKTLLDAAKGLAG